MSRTLEELKLGFARIEAAQACRNLMGRYSYLHTAMRHNEFITLWADRDDCILYMPWGIYYGKQGVIGCYKVDHGDRSDPEIQNDPIMKGGMFMHCMDTEVLEVAGDCKTAKGAWISPGHESWFAPDPEQNPEWKKGDPVSGGLVSNVEWAWSKYSVEFINEDGIWKFWKMRLYPLYKTGFDVPWTVIPEMPEGEFPFKECERLPEPPWLWTPDSVYPADQPEPPLPYDTYDPAAPAFWQGLKPQETK